MFISWLRAVRSWMRNNFSPRRRGWRLRPLSVRPTYEPLEERTLPANYTVTATADSGAGSLRQAILDANANAGADTIDFNIVGAGPHTIAPTTALPTITEAVILDGYTQPGASANTLAVGSDAVLKIVIDGNSTSTGVSGLTITAGGSTIRGLVINRFPTTGIVLSGSSATGNLIAGNYIGTDAADTSDLGNAQQGIEVSLGTNNTIGGTTAAARNVISGNAVSGIEINGSGASANLVQGNYIGTNEAGSADLGNTQYGINIVNAVGNTVGGSTSNSRNIISGNDIAGVRIGGGGSNVVQANYLGLAVDGTTPVGNGTGVNITDQTTNNTIGGITATAGAAPGNVISGNTGRGVLFNDLNTAGNVLLGNLIGTDATGELDRGNVIGVLLDAGSTGTTVGGSTAGAGNLISGNNSYGVQLAGGTAGNLVQGNFIGTDASGLLSMGNTLAGVFFTDAAGTAPTNNVIGGAAPGAEADNRVIAQHVYADDNPTATLYDNYTITVTVSDDHGGGAPAANAVVTVSNVAPRLLSGTSPALVTFSDRATFVTATGAIGVPLANRGVVGTNFTTPGGELTFSSGPGSGNLFSGAVPAAPVVGSDWTVRLAGPDIAISGPENLDIDLAAPAYAFGFGFVEPQADSNLNTAFIASTFTVTLKSGTSVVGTFTFSRTPDTAAFVGVQSDRAFDRVEIRETTGGDENEFFGTFYVRTAPVTPLHVEPLDLTFGGGGKVITNAGGDYEFINAVTVLADGKILATGYSFSAATDFDFSLIRYRADGSLDTSFGTGGTVITDFGSGGDDAGFGLAVQADGKIVLGGYTQIAGLHYALALVRYHADGSLDTSFGSGGKVTTDLSPGFSALYDVAIQDDGKIVAAGFAVFDGPEVAFPDALVVRYNSNGTLDTTFDDDGHVSFDYSGGDDTWVGLEVQADGKVVVGGWAFDDGDGYHMALARYTTTGALDTSFDADGLAITTLASVDEWFEDIALQDDGKIVGVGVSGDFNNFTDYDTLVARYHTDGSLDTSFGGGVVQTDLGSDREAFVGVAVAPDGKIVAGGWVALNGSNQAFALARFNAEGTLDTTFDLDGKVFTKFGPQVDGLAGTEAGFGVALQPDGKIVLGGGAGTVTGDFALARYGLSENDTATLRGTIVDPGSGDSHTVTIDWGDGTLPQLVNVAAGVTSFNPTHVYADNGFYVVTATVLDDDSGSGGAPIDVTVTVANAPPRVEILDAPVTSPEGSEIGLTTLVTDPGSGDTFTYQWTVTKDGVPLIFDEDGGVKSFGDFTRHGASSFATTTDPTFSFTPHDDGTYVVTLLVSDDEGATGTSVRTILVVNVPAVATISGAPATVNTGTALNLTANVNEPSAVDLAALTYAWEVVKEGAALATGGGTTFSYTPATVGVYTISLTVTDDNGSVTTSVLVPVGGGPPTATIVGAPPAGVPVNEGTPVVLFSDVFDPLNSDTVTYEWRVTKDLTDYAVAATPNLTFIPDDDGVYHVTLTVTSPGGRSGGSALEGNGPGRPTPWPTRRCVPILKGSRGCGGCRAGSATRVRVGGRPGVAAEFGGSSVVHRDGTPKRGVPWAWN